MAQVLVIESSARIAGSWSRLLVREYVEMLQRHSGPHDIVRRDLGQAPVPVLDSGMVEAIRTRPEQLSPEQRAATALSEHLIAELKAADIVVIGAPMYNWGVPAALKAWLDQVMRVGLTFEYSGDGARGLLGGKPAVVFLARAGSYSAPDRAHLDFQRPYLTRVLEVIGLVPTFVLLESTIRGQEFLQDSLKAVRETIHNLAARVV